MTKSSAQSDGLSKKISQESYGVSHTTKKTSVTMRTKLCKRPSLLSSDMSKTINTKMPLEELQQYLDKPSAFDDLERITPNSDMKTIENTLVKYCRYVLTYVFIKLFNFYIRLQEAKHS